MTERILITGGSGFIGTNLVQLCQDRKLGEVVNVDRRAPRNHAHAENWVNAELRDQGKIIEVFTDFSPTQVYHLAARTDLHSKEVSDYADNVDGVRTIVDAVNATKSVSRAVFASSRLVCSIDYVPSTDTDYHPPNAYGRSKVLGEQIVRAEARPDVWTLVRPTSIWGPWFDVPYRDFFDTIERGYYFRVRGHEGVAKSFGYVGNTVHQLAELMAAPAGSVVGRMFYLADYTPTRVNEMAECVRQTMRAPRIRVLPYPALKAAAIVGDIAKRAGWKEPPITSFRLHNLLTDMVFDLSPLETVVGSVPHSVEAGVAATVRWMRTQQPD